MKPMDFIPTNSAASLIKSLNKQLSKLKRSIDSGRFMQWSYQKRQYLIARILHLLQLLRSRGVKVAGTLSIALLSSLSVSAQFGAPFMEECESSPLDGLTLFEFSEEEEGNEGDETYLRQTLSGDLDNDGDDDLLIISHSSIDGYFLQYFENIEGAFVELIGDDNPLEIFNDEFLGSGIPPIFNFSLGDATLNGRLDLVLGESKGDIVCFANTGTGFEEPEEKDIDAMSNSEFSNVIFSNLDEDCEEELIIIPRFTIGGGEEAPLSVITVFDNVNGQFVASPTMDAMFEDVAINEEDLIFPNFFDIDGDGIDELVLVVMDQLLGKGRIDFYEKVEGSYEEVPTFESPFSGYDFSDGNGPFGDQIIPIFDFGDLDGDGNLNMYVGYKSNSAVISDAISCFDSAIPYTPPCLLPARPIGAIPTIGQWGMIILSLIFLILGALFMKEKNVRSFSVLKPRKEN